MASKREKKLRCQELLQQLSKFIPLESPDGMFLEGLVKRHPEAPEKIGCGISHFSVAYSAVGGYRPSKHFVLHRVDGTSTDFSYNKCIDNRTGGPVPRQRTLPNRYTYSALRNAIFPQLTAFKEAFFCQPPSALVCDISGYPLTPADTEIDHAVPNSFAQLVQDWLATEGITLDQVELTTGDNTAGTLANPYLERSWQQYHKLHAQLRAVSSSAHRAHTALWQQQQALASSSSSTHRGDVAPAGATDDLTA